MNPQEIVNTMMAKDYFSQWLGIEIIEIKEGSSKLKMTVRQEMLNGFGIAHGGITYSFADSALAFASNSHGQKAVSVETSISHTISLKADDVIIAEASEEHCSNKIGIYTIKIYKTSDNSVVALFKGTVYRTSKVW
ncbi:MAG: phenylacetic acid degradation protein PaaD [Sphingobacteriaceae bacterium]|nr:phenylacetic acid degradation protein PaaD [Sphingobacteriaceae bacterium]